MPNSLENEDWRSTRTPAQTEDSALDHLADEFGIAALLMDAENYAKWFRSYDFGCNGGRWC